MSLRSADPVSAGACRADTALAAPADVPAEMPTATPQADSASAAVATLVARFGCVLMAVFLRFRRPPIGRAERAEPASVAIRLRSCCDPAQPERDRGNSGDLGEPSG